LLGSFQLILHSTCEHGSLWYSLVDNDSIGTVSRCRTLVALGLSFLQALIPVADSVPLPPPAAAYQQAALSIFSESDATASAPPAVEVPEDFFDSVSTAPTDAGPTDTLHRGRVGKRPPEPMLPPSQEQSTIPLLTSTPWDDSGLKSVENTFAEVVGGKKDGEGGVNMGSSTPPGSGSDLLHAGDSPPPPSSTPPLQ